MVLVTELGDGDALRRKAKESVRDRGFATRQRGPARGNAAPNGNPMRRIARAWNPRKAEGAIKGVR